MNNLQKLVSNVANKHIEIILLGSKLYLAYLLGIKPNNDSFLIWVKRKNAVYFFEKLPSSKNFGGEMEIVRIRYDCFEEITAFINNCIKRQKTTILVDKDVLALKDSLISKLSIDFSLDIGIEEYLYKTRKEKSEWEIDRIKKASLVGEKAFDAAKRAIKPGLREKQLALVIDNVLKNNGIEETYFPTCVSAGKNSSVIGYTSGEDPIMNDDIVLIDFGGPLNYYMCDICRTILIGNPKQEIKEIYAAVLATHLKLLSIVKLGMKCGTLFDFVYDEFLKLGGMNRYLPLDYVLGHGIGIEGREPPMITKNNNEILEENMVINLEPGLYIPGVAGVRIEDTVIIRKYSTELVTVSNRDVRLWL